MTTRTEITDVEFGDPPEPSRGIMGKVPALLAKKPGKWAKVRTDMTQRGAQRYASKIRHGHVALFPKGQYEAIARLGTEPESYDIWMRYVGAG